MYDDERLFELNELYDTFNALKLSITSKDILEELDYILEKYSDEYETLQEKEEQEYEKERKKEIIDFERSRL